MSENLVFLLVAASDHTFSCKVRAGGLAGENLRKTFAFSQRGTGKYHAKVPTGLLFTEW